MRHFVFARIQREPSSSLVHILAFLAVLGGVSFIVVTAYLHWVDGARWTHRLISEFAYGRHGVGYTTALYIHGIGNLALAAALYRVLPGTPRFSGVALLYGLAAIGILIAGFIKTAPPDPEPMAFLNFHQTVVVGTMVIQLSALFAFAGVSSELLLPRAYMVFCRAWPWLCAAGLTWLAVAFIVFNHAGLSERVVVAMFLTWELWSAILLLTDSVQMAATRK